MQIRFFGIRDIKDYLKINGTVPNAEKNSEQYNFFINQALQRYKNFDEACKSEIYGETEISGLRIDFNFGLRLEIPTGNWHVKISDFDSGIIFFDENISDTRLISFEKYFIRWQIDISLNGEKIFSHTLDLEGQKVLIDFPSTALGDNLALFPYVKDFQKLHNCEIYARVPKFLQKFFEQVYSDIPTVEKNSYEYYATYYPEFIIGDVLHLPVDARTTPMQQLGKYIFGLNEIPQLPKFQPTKLRQIEQPYVCIGVQASMPQKGWLFPNGWDIVVKYLKDLGYRVLCIDKNSKENGGGYTIRKPKGAEDFTGNISILERANMLYYADFIVGLGSGLAWLANFVGCPAVVISGFSEVWFEFETPYRVKNNLLCGGCLNDVRVNFIAKKSCPYYSDTPREMECQKKISPQQVLDAVNRAIVETRNF